MNIIRKEAKILIEILTSVTNKTRSLNDYKFLPTFKSKSKLRNFFYGKEKYNQIFFLLKIMFKITKYEIIR